MTIYDELKHLFTNIITSLPADTLRLYLEALHPEMSKKEIEMATYKETVTFHLFKSEKGIMTPYKGDRTADKTRAEQQYKAFRAALELLDDVHDICRGVYPCRYICGYDNCAYEIYYCAKGNERALSHILALKPVHPSFLSAVRRIVVTDPNANPDAFARTGIFFVCYVTEDNDIEITRTIGESEAWADMEESLK